MKYILLLFLLSGCSWKVDLADIDLAKSVCIAHGGMESINKKDHNDFTVRCQDGLRVKIINKPK